MSGARNTAQARSRSKCVWYFCGTGRAGVGGQNQHARLKLNLVMPNITEEQLRPFPEPEWVTPPDYTDLVWVGVLLAVMVLVVVLVTWYKRKRCAVDLGWQTLRTLLQLRAQLAALEQASVGDFGSNADQAETCRPRTLLFIFDSAYLTLRTWSQLCMKVHTPLTSAKCLADRAYSTCQAVEKLTRLLSELEQARFCGRCPDQRWLAAQLDHAAALLAQSLCRPKQEGGSSQ